MDKKNYADEETIEKFNSLNQQVEEYFRDGKYYCFFKKLFEVNDLYFTASFHRDESDRFWKNWEKIGPAKCNMYNALNTTEEKKIFCDILGSDYIIKHISPHCNMCGINNPPEEVDNWL